MAKTNGTWRPYRARPERDTVVRWRSTFSRGSASATTTRRRRPGTSACSARSPRSSHTRPRRLGAGGASLAVHRPGHGGRRRATHTIFVDDLDARVADIASRGIGPDAMETYPGKAAQGDLSRRRRQRDRLRRGDRLSGTLATRGDSTDRSNPDLIRWSTQLEGTPDEVRAAWGSGQVGTVLARALAREGHEVVVVSRTGARGDGARVVGWNARSIGPWAAEIDGADVVVNLAGRSVNCRYTAANRWSILDSRLVSPSRLAARSTRAVRRRPRALTWPPSA